MSALIHCGRIGVVDFDHFEGSKVPTITDIAETKTTPESAVDPGAYWQRWRGWTRGGLTQESKKH